ncbi:hypothetical protein QBC34DRAFT_387694 [Podospora aff. communis PSN243]|uniref:Nephrocystin 3-like N-terminal domain-containing protein n=1 Tax=Podospora aff. communis PSN243 TaxID=3040156 RepID=A0AAV9FVE9_9PEZI|nr:hypothetical protein QBC34DRAFT_387694 [Podospora aff. communis PSN243]
MEIVSLIHQKIREARTPGTCEWILKHPDFKAWQNATKSSAFWLKVGGWKTFLTSKIIDHLQDDMTLVDDSNTGLAFLYCAELRGPDSYL